MTSHKPLEDRVPRGPSVLSYRQVNVIDLSVRDV